MIQFPNISPEIFNFNLLGFQFALRWYAVSYICGFICALVIMKFFIVRAKLWKSSEPPITTEQADNLLTYLIIGVIFGGRLGYVLFYNFGYYTSHPLDIFRVWDGGMSFHGGFLGVIVAVYYYALVNRLALCHWLIFFTFATWFIFGRLANFINAGLWGSTTLPWGVVFPGKVAKNCGHLIEVWQHHRSSMRLFLKDFLFLILLYEAIKGVLIYPGWIVGVIALGYCLERYFVEFFRVPDAQFVSTENPRGYVLEIYNFGISMGQLLSVPMILIGVLLILLSFWFKKLEWRS